MPRPPLTDLQFIVLQVVAARERSGREIRDALLQEGERKTLAAFYQLMSRLEDGGLVKGRYVRIEVGGQSVNERRYKITDSGLRSWHTTREFYTNRSLATGQAGGEHV